MKNNKRINALLINVLVANALIVTGFVMYFVAIRIRINYFDDLALRNLVNSYWTAVGFLALGGLYSIVTGSVLLAFKNKSDLALAVGIVAVLGGGLLMNFILPALALQKPKEAKASEPDQPLQNWLFFNHA